jgi:hypothetical protein
MALASDPGCEHAKEGAAAASPSDGQWAYLNVSAPSNDIVGSMHARFVAQLVVSTLEAAGT